MKMELFADAVPKTAENFRCGQSIKSTPLQLSMSSMSQELAELLEKVKIFDAYH